MEEFTEGKLRKLSWEAREYVRVWHVVTSFSVRVKIRT